MIENKKDYKYYLECDIIANRTKIHSLRDRILNKPYSYLKLLRRAEYYKNCNFNFFGKIIYYLTILKLLNRSRKYGWYIPINVVGPGLSLAHEGAIVINSGSKIGANCRIHSGVNIGTSAGNSYKSPQIGDNVYIGPGAKLFGDITIGNDIAIGANSVVNKSFEIDSVTLAGVPAKIVSKKGSVGLYFRATEEHKKLNNGKSA